MKKRILSSLLLFSLILSLLLVGCGEDVPKGPFNVTFEGAQTITVDGGAQLTAPDIAPRDGYTLSGWYQDKARTKAWDFAEGKVVSDLTLYPVWEKTNSDPFVESDDDKDFSALKTPGSQENEYEYQSYFLPAVDGIKQPYVGDPMPYYEDGVYYIYYLKDGGDSYNHSFYLATTTDFVTYKEYDAPVLESDRGNGQDAWLGTGSVVKVNDTYYFFYTGHAASPSFEYKEKIMVAKSKDLYSFEKVAGWEIAPPDDLRQKNDFRDPQAYYDAATDTIHLTITGSKAGVARVLKYSLKGDLTGAHYDGVIFSNTVGDFWNLECTDTFRIGETWYLTYSAQDDTLWYATASEQYGPYSEPKRLEGMLFYAAKHVEDGENSYMVGWARRSESVSSTTDVSGWGGNLVVQKLVQKENGDLYLAPVDAVVEQYQNRRPLLVDASHVYAEAGSKNTYYDVFNCYERFAISGEFQYDGKGAFGLAFDFNGKQDKYKMITIDPKAQKLQLSFNEGSTLISEVDLQLEQGKTYSFTYIQEGSVGVFYIDGQAALTVRIYGASGKPIRLFAANNTVFFTSLRQYT